MKSLILAGFMLLGVGAMGQEPTFKAELPEYALSVSDSERMIFLTQEDEVSCTPATSKEGKKYFDCGETTVHVLVIPAPPKPSGSEL